MGVNYASPDARTERRPLPGLATAACVAPVFLTLIAILLRVVWPAGWEIAFIVAVVAAQACPVIATIGGSTTPRRTSTHRGGDAE
jgi:hypothetical protein